MDHDRFDDLTRTLATSTSRRQALKLLGGGLLAALVPRAALAKGGNSACSKFCANTFGADTPAAKQCTSDAAKGKGLCYTCGPAAPATHPPLCGQTCCTTSVANATAACNNGTCGFTCNAGYKECNGACIPNDQCCGGCSTNETCVNGTCEPALPTHAIGCICADGTPQVTCTSAACSLEDSRVVCDQLCANQGGVGGMVCSDGQTCTSTCNCSADEVCQNGTCVPAPSGFPYACICADGTPQGTCDSAPCSVDGLNAVCGQLCADHGGSTGATCGLSTC